MSAKLVVVIPVHKETISVNEKISLEQCMKILGKYDVYLVFPTGLNTNVYLSIYPTINLQPVLPDWLSSIEGYNRMKRSIEFYELFTAYEYMLTYELDSFIFSDKWDSAHCFQCDYIGALWFDGYANARAASKIIGCGNSGFSMRNIVTCLTILRKIEKVRPAYLLFAKSRLNRIIRFTYLLRLFSTIWNVNGKNHFFNPLISKHHINEDLFWGHIVPELFKFKLANIQDCVKFSFEVNPSELYKMNDYKLPIGCHGWEKYDPEFWKPFIELVSNQ